MLAAASLAAWHTSDIEKWATAGTNHQSQVTNHQAAAPVPNIIVLLIDTLRADHLGFMGYRRPISPVLDRWAAESVVFERAYSPAPWTVPSIASVFTSLNPEVHHVVERYGRYGASDIDREGDQLADEAETIAEAFSANGYQTAAIVANPWLEREHGFAQGFASYEFLWRGKQKAAAPALLSGMDKWLASRSKAKPFFLYLHFMDVHAPYDAPDVSRDPLLAEVRSRMPSAFMPPELRKRHGHLKAIEPATPRVDPELAGRPDYWIALYDAGIAALDGRLAQLQDRLEREGLWDDTILIVTADHGEALNEQGGWDHGFSPYDHQLHVPLVVRCPKRFSPRRVSTTVSLLGLKPTLLELAGLSGGAFVQGQSFAPLVKGAAPQDEGFAFAEGVKYDGQLKAAYRGDRKIVVDAKTGRAVLFDVRTDPLEQRPAPLPPDSAPVSELKRRLDSVMAENAAHAGDIPQRRRFRAPDRSKQLRQIGYLQADEGGPTAPLPGAFKFDGGAAGQAATATAAKREGEPPGEPARQEPRPPETAAGRPHVILISLCSVRADHLGCYGYPRATSPAIDALARESVVFEHATTPWPKTAPSFCSVMTGLYPHETNVLRTTPNQRLGDNVQTLAERIKAAGYRTGAFITSPALHKGLNLTQGFEVYEETFRDQIAKAGTVESALRWLGKNKGEPCLLWVHFNDAHYRYLPDESLKDMFVDDAHYDDSKTVRLNARDMPIRLPEDHPAPEPVRRADLGGVHPLALLPGRETELDFYVARYDAAIRTADEKIGRLIAGIGASVGDSPLIVALWSDHGESLGEHNYYFEHGRFPYQTCAHVPLMVRDSRRWPAGKRSDTPVSSMDVAATILDLLSISPEGTSGVPLARVAAEKGERGDVFFCAGYHPDFITGVRRGNYKLISISNPLDRQMMRRKPFELYDLAADPGETRDLSEGKPEIVMALSESLRGWRDPWWPRVVTQTAKPPDEYDRELRAKLKALGYINE